MVFHGSESQLMVDFSMLGCSGGDQTTRAANSDMDHRYNKFTVVHGIECILELA